MFNIKYVKKLSKELNKKGFQIGIKNRFNTNDLNTLRFCIATLCEAAPAYKEGLRTKTCVNTYFQTKYMKYKHIKNTNLTMSVKNRFFNFNSYLLWNLN